MPRRKVQPEAESDEAPQPEVMVPGVARALSPMARRILANNPGVMTGPGTNTYLVGIDEVVVIDPGPEDEAHLDAIIGCGGDRIRWITVTHTHPDHAPGVRALKERTGADVLGWGAKDGFKPDTRIRDGFTIEATEFRLKAIHTPGHASNHVCWLLEEERMLFSGDHIMQGSTVVIRPPDGDMAAYLQSLEKLKKLRLRSIAPGHGTLIEEPNALIDWYLAHRREREAKVLAALREQGSAKIEALLPVVYGDVDPALYPVARYSLHAHLLKLADDGLAAGRTLTGLWKAT